MKFSILLSVLLLSSGLCGLAAEIIKSAPVTVARGVIGATLQPGAKVDIIKESGEFVRIRYKTPHITVEGVISKSALAPAKPGDPGAIAKTAKTKVTLSRLHSAMIMYELERNKYPASLQVLVDERIMNEIKPDGWGVPFQYNAKTGEIKSSGGPDGPAISSKDL